MMTDLFRRTATVTAMTVITTAETTATENIQQQQHKEFHAHYLHKVIGVASYGALGHVPLST